MEPMSRGCSQRPQERLIRVDKAHQCSQDPGRLFLSTDCKGNRDIKQSVLVSGGVQPKIKSCFRGKFSSQLESGQFENKNLSY